MNNQRNEQTSDVCVGVSVWIKTATHCIIVQIVTLSIAVPTLPSLQNLLFVLPINTGGADGCVCKGV